ncbi:MAG: hypothetical protein UV07_C0003G0032 [Candidatus Azambacteria bacterium GW2011_GWB1_42_17]|uniref:Uncharacterized protein n=1 Tax=Candidatus Azambacteria bacterium GW2011_GWB1_42_17 TaxID=1618615 RepID=A0A0G0Z7T1_9BACT|nr:MAG: hypothetical protein UV07_C0003G0032 [Candidatus Azambacteria bacterium GW2011_GWB1_42_17]
MKFLKWCWVLLLILVPVSSVFAQEEYINVVNPVRVSKYNISPSLGIEAEYKIISDYDLPATWLLTFDVLNDIDSINVISEFNKNQEVGIFLEISPEFAKQTNIEYHQSGSWHFANSIFLSGYTQEERIKLIDKVFSKFKEQFGYYPTSVGAWWVDSFSLKYMYDKYGITANLSCADQFSTDNYQIWGTYWSTPYYPSVLHSGLPAKGTEDKIGVVTIQWASRHPRNGYYSSLYSLQDYLTTPERYDSEYFKNLLQIYARKNRNLFGQVTVGLEADLTPEVYQQEFLKQMQIVTSDSATKLTMSDFSKWYRNKFPDISPEQTIDFDGIVWFQSPHYRLGIDKTNKKIIDFRIYPLNFKEPYYLWPNRERNLRINIPALVDSVQDSSEAWNITDLNIKTSSKYFESTNKPPARLFKSKLVKIQKINGKWRVEVNLEDNKLNEGIIFNDWSLETKHLLKATKSLIRTIVSFNWDRFKREKYWISPEEIVALDKLKQQPVGKVLVYDHECLQCEYFGKYRPAVFANSRNYIQKYSEKSIVYNSEIFDAQSQSELKSKVKSAGIGYIYVSKYAPEVELLRFSPGDYGIEKTFENAVVQIWKVVK